MEPIEIKYNRKKTLLILLLALTVGLIFCFSCWNLVSYPTHYTSHRNSPEIAFLAMLLGLIFIGTAIPVILKMLFRRNPALIIDERGITEYTTFMSIGLIHWEDIISIKEGKVKSTHFITIHIKNKKKYLALSKGPLQTYMMKLNLKHYKPKLYINTSALQIKHNELNDILLKAFDTYKKH